jgi:hypothetical protein
MLLRAVADMVRADPDLFDRVLVTTGKILEKTRPIVLAPPTVPAQQSRALTDQLISLGDQVFQTPNPGQPSVGRELFDVLHRIGQSARDLPPELALMARYRKLSVDASGNPTAASELVDWTQPATTAGSAAGENRSTLQQLLDLLNHADQCQTYVFFGKPLSETIIELMAGQNVGTAQTLIGFLGNPIVRAAAELMCSGIGNDLDSLSALSQSGALNGFLPIAKAFVDKGETRLLINLLNTIDQNYSTIVRPDESKIADLLASGAFDSIFDLLDLLVAGRAGGQPIADPVSGARAIDVIADAIGALLAHPSGGVPDRFGVAHPTMAHLVLDPLRRIDDNVTAVSGGQALHTALAYAVTDLLIERITDASGNEVLRNPSIGPFLGRLLDLMARNMPADATARTQLLSDSQQRTIDALASHDFAIAFDLAGSLRQSAGTGPIRDALVHLLTPDPVAPDDLFGSLLKLLASGLETQYDAQALRDLESFAGDLLDPAAGRVVNLVEGASKILTADTGHTVITLLRNALNQPPAGAGLAAGETPAGVLIDVMNDVRAAGNAGGTQTATDRVADLESTLRAAIAFIGDSQSGLERVFDVIRNRPH